jgi:outer membrane protein assembly factor BamB
MMHARKPVLLCLALLLFGVLAAGARAVSTRQFSLDSAGVLSAGKLEGAAVLSRGAVVRSVSVRRIALENVGVARSLLVRADGTALVGTGNNGKLFKVAGDAAALLAETGELLVSALCEAEDGTVYAGTLPHGKIFAIDKQGKSRLFSQPEGAEHIWALGYDGRKHTLFAATGPHGKIFAIDTKGKADVYYSGKASHIMALALAADGSLYAGTSDDALLLHIEGPGRAQVLYDFEGNEVTAIALQKGRVAAAANQFPKPTTPSTDKKKDETKKDDQQSTDKTEVTNKDTPKPGTGELWVVESSGQARKLFSSTEDGHITSVQWEKSGAIYAATSKGGHIFRVEPDGTNALWIDVDEREVLDLQLSSDHPMFVTGDAGAVYRLLPGPASEALWTSKVLDAQFLSRFGQLSWRGQGKLTFQTRSGNTEKPDDAWSQWSSVLSEPGPIRSPAARFLQLKARLDTSADCTLYAVQAYYLPANQPATLKDISIKPVPPKGNDEAASASYKIEWKPDNPDGDRLRYRLEYRPEDQSLWRPILRESEILTKTSYEWSTDGVPDGYYRVRIDASDELDNPAHEVLHKNAESEPFLLDNHPPHVDDLRYANGRISGIARDDMGPISKLEYALDSQDWKPFYPKDDLFDTRTEPFELEVKDLDKGPHVVAVRTKDARNNVGSAEIWITVK